MPSKVLLEIVRGDGDAVVLVAAMVSTIRLVLSRLVVSGSTESRVDSRKVPPSMMSASFCGPCVAQAQFLLDELELGGVDLGQHAVGVGEQLRQADRDGGLALRDDAAVAQEGPGVGVGSKSMYCSPAADRPETRTSLDAGIGTVDLMLATALTPRA